MFLVNVPFYTKKYTRDVLRLPQKHLGMSLFFLDLFDFPMCFTEMCASFVCVVIPLWLVPDGDFFNKMKGVFLMGYDVVGSIQCSVLVKPINVLKISIQIIISSSRQARGKGRTSDEQVMNTWTFEPTFSGNFNGCPKLLYYTLMNSWS